MGQPGHLDPETTWFNGLEDLPQYCREMRDLTPHESPGTKLKEFDDYASNKNGLQQPWNYR